MLNERCDLTRFVLKLCECKDFIYAKVVQIGEVCMKVTILRCECCTQMRIVHECCRSG